MVASRRAAFNNKVQASAGFNPLHCGAVVASILDGAPDDAPAVFQSPSLRGSGRFDRVDRGRGARRRVSIPFIAGQWSLPLAWEVRVSPQKKVSIPFIAGQWSLRDHGSPVAQCARHVSIPFIAGQWSLRARRMAGVEGGGSFNPLHCGAVVASITRLRNVLENDVSIPFIAGQWSLQLKVARVLQTKRRWFQSPSLRGSGRFVPPMAVDALRAFRFQSPSLRGSGRFALRRIRRRYG